MDDNTVKEHTDATFSCEVFPSYAKITWFVNDQEIEKGGIFKMRSEGAERHFTFPKARKTDEGVVTAMVGDVECTACLGVEGMHNYMFSKLIAYSFQITIIVQLVCLFKMYFRL